MSTKLYSYSDFDGFQNSTIQILISIGTFTNSINVLSLNLQLIVSFPGLIVSMFHITALCQKTMRTSCINVIMIGIGVFDLLTMVFIIYDGLAINLRNECTPPWTYFDKIIELFNAILEDSSRRLVAWFGVFMASLRYFIIKNSLNPKMAKFSEPIFSIKTMIFMFFLSTGMSTFYFGRDPIKSIDVWKVPEGCAGFPGTYDVYQSGVDYRSKTEYEWDTQVFNLLDGSLRIIPSIIFLILTFFLVKELRKAEDSRRKVSGVSKNITNPDSTTKLVILMTITFILAEGPFGIAYFFQSIVTEPPGLVNISYDFVEMWGILKVVNSSIHCVICLKVSTQYRKSVKEILKCGSGKVNNKQDFIKFCTDFDHIPARYVRNAKKDGFTVQNFKNDLANLGLTEMFPDVQKYAKVMHSEVFTTKKEALLRTCDLFKAVEKCLLHCIFKRYPTVSEQRK